MHENTHFFNIYVCLGWCTAKDIYLTSEDMHTPHRDLEPCHAGG